MRRYYVRYRVEGKEEQFEAGPYLSFGEAMTHYNDIAGYDRVWDAHIVDREEP